MNPKRERLQGQDTVLFLHIPKAAGITLHRIINHQYPADVVHTLDLDRREEALEGFQRLPEEERGRFRVVKGHFGYGFHELIPRPCTYITMLRNPFARICSLYHYARGLERHYLHPVIAEQNLSLEEFLASGATPELDNGMTKLISGEFTPFGGCTAEHLEKAKQILDDHFAVVGLVERFDESLLLMRHEFNWSYPFYVPENVTRDKPRHAPPSDEARRIFDSHNAFDLELYRHVADQLQQTLDAQPDAFHRDLRLFRALNGPLGFARQVIRRAKWLFGGPPTYDYSKT